MAIDWAEFRRTIDRKRSSLLALRQGHESLFRDIAEQIAPKAGRNFFVTQKNSREYADDMARKLINAAPVRALEKSAGGFMANITNAAVRWFKLSIESPEGRTPDSVEKWLDILTDVVYSVLQKAGLYNDWHTGYSHVLAFGTSAKLITTDIRTVIRSVLLSPGTYAIDSPCNGRVNRLVRDIEMTLDEYRSEFGEEVMTFNQKKLWKEGNTSSTVTVFNLVEPNDDSFADSLPMLKERHVFRSIYFVGDQTVADKGIIAVRGYSFNPIVAPRFKKESGDVWGSGPGETAVALAKGLQYVQKDVFKAIGKYIDPPQIASSAMRNSQISLSPGSITFVGENQPLDQNAIRPMYTQNVPIQHLEEFVTGIERKIFELFYVDMFAALETYKGSGAKTAFEIQRIITESLQGLAPVIQRLDSEEFDPVISIVVRAVLDAQLVPPPPDELNGPLKVEYISTVHAAMKAGDTNSMMNFAGFLGEIAKLAPDVMDNLDTDEMVRRVRSAMNIPAAVMKDEEVVAMIREARAARQQAAEQSQQTQQMADAAAKVGGIPTGPDSMASKVMG